MAKKKQDYEIFEITLVKKQQLSPSFMRLTFGADEVKYLQAYAPDQWVKLIFPKIAGEGVRVPDGVTPYDYYRSLPEEIRPDIRNYTIRYLRPEANEVDVDFVLHGAEGPASAWAIEAEIGAKIFIMAQCEFPDHRAEDLPEIGSFVWSPPTGAQEILLMADETALPAAIGILEQLSALEKPPKVTAYFEVPYEEDCLPTPIWSDLNLQYLPRNVGAWAVGAQLIAAAHLVAIPEIVENAEKQVNDEIPEDEIVWQRADAADDSKFYAWIAGETSAMRTIRLTLTKQRGLNKQLLNFMGYWRKDELH
ncbi:MAG: siderophore-interacting protein [Alphaproteobacteria bacterium]|nr:siderophore-interacting protein [Alphaproteobacteria bacterium]